MKHPELISLLHPITLIHRRLHEETSTIPIAINAIKPMPGLSAWMKMIILVATFARTLANIHP